jgi:hypothetical protein
LALSRLLLDRLSAYLRGQASARAGYRDVLSLKEAALRLHPDLLAEGRQRLTPLAQALPTWGEAIDAALATWQFRQDMLKELAP